MSSMRPALLGDLATLRAGVGFPLDLQGRASGDYPLAKVGDISRIARSGEAVLSTADHYVDKGDLVRLKASLIPTGSILFSKIGEAIRQNHRVIAGCPLLIDNNAMAAIPSQRVESRFLYHFLRTVDFYTLASATTVPALRKSELERLKVPLPALPEQRRIAAILDKADTLRRKRKRALKLYDRLTRSIFLEMFGDLVQSSEYQRGTVSDWVADFATGKNLAPDPDDRQINGYRVLKVSAVTTGVFLPNEAKPLPAEYRPPASHLVGQGDLLFSRANTAELIGATAYVDSAPEKLVLPDKIWRFIWNSGNEPAPLFIQALFSTPSFRREISKRATGTSGSMKNISKEKVLGIEIALPSRPLQDAYVARHSTVHRISSVARMQLVELERQFSALQHRAFSGQL